MITIQRAFTAIAAVALLGLAVPAHTATPAKKPAAAKAAPKAKAAAATGAAAAALTPDQLAVAGRVHTGAADCEFSQSVQVEKAGQDGWFNVSHKGKRYLMAPENTTTGAVRLEDKKTGVMWLQIANKSMLMNSKAGQRMVDNCTHPAQRG
jgi:hypothetical protein